MKQVLFILLVFISFQGGAQETIKISGLEFMTKDLGKMDWNKAQAICDSMGNGWRLPTKDELIKMYKLRESIGGFRNYGRGYWTSSNYSDVSRWCINFSNGNIYFDSKYSYGQLRAVRDLK